MAVQFGEINVVVTDLERSLAFYRDALGLAEVGREGGAVRLSLGPVTLLILPFARQVNDVDGGMGWAVADPDGNIIEVIDT